MAAKKRADLQKAKEKKEKIILAVLVGLLVIVGALELPKMLKKSSSPPAVAATQTTSTSPGATPSGAAPSGPVAVSSLPNPSPYEAGNGQLSEFSLFNGRDPFGSVTPATSTLPATTPTPTSTSNTPAKAYAAANISINGASQVVLLNAAFPSSSPAFVLDSVTATQAKIGVNGGSFANGQAKVSIKKGRSVVLVNTVDSTRYVIKYIAPLTSEQASALTTSTATSGSTIGITTGGSTTGGSTTGGTTTGTTP
jgi:hypothetical protein